MSALVGLQCHLCKTPFPAEAIYVCDRCLGPLEPVYDYGAIRLTREEIAKRPKNLWRYRELLPIADTPRTGFNSGFTPLVRCDRLEDPWRMVAEVELCAMSMRVAYRRPARSSEARTSWCSNG